ncbi:MAG: cell division protein FtsZ [Verrucomicrobiota bacterium]
MTSDTTTTTAPVKKELAIHVIGVGGAGGNTVAHMSAPGLAGVSFTAINTDSQALAHCAVPGKLQFGDKIMRGLGAGGDPGMGRAAAESDVEALKKLCAGADLVIILAGMGGGTGTGASPVLARVARESGALVLGVVTLPFECEGARRRRQAQQGLDQFKAAADGVICLPNQKVFALIDENTSLVETFKLTNELLTLGVRGIWQLLTRPGLINIDFADLCAAVRGRQAESFFATAEAMGPNRARQVMDEILGSPLLDGGQRLSEADAVLVSLVGGPDLGMVEVNRLMEQINRQCENAHLILGAAIDDAYTDRLSVTIIASRHGKSQEETADAGPEESAAETPALLHDSAEMGTQFLSAPIPRPASRFVAPAPELTPEQQDKLLAAQAGQTARQRKKAAQLRQQQLPLEIISKGRFEKSEPTLHHGEDLDVPTYIRRGVALN